MNGKIDALDAIEILDSRGNPTIRVMLRLSDGREVCAAVPSGASTGRHEAIERRDNDPRRYGGKGVQGVVATVREEIAPLLAGRDCVDQREIDHALCALDGTENKARLGANAILGASMAVARAGALTRALPLYRHLGTGPAPEHFSMPVPLLNVINGGQHAVNSVDFQEFMLVPLGAPNFAEAMRYAAETYQMLKSLLKGRGLATAVGDEGGFAPNLVANEDACDLIVAAIEAAGLRPGVDVSIALDPAASSFGSADGGYEFAKSSGERATTEQLIELYTSWVKRFPIVSIEDGVAEDDWAGYAQMTERLGQRIQIVGDDNYVTNPRFIRRGIDEGSTNAVLIKPNQIGTVSETIDAITLCHGAGWNAVVSHRSGETDDTFIADLAVGRGCSQIKSGAPCRGERLAKYNRLIEIEHELVGEVNFSRPFMTAPVILT